MATRTLRSTIAICGFGTARIGSITALSRLRGQLVLLALRAPRVLLRPSRVQPARRGRQGLTLLSPAQPARLVLRQPFRGQPARLARLELTQLFRVRLAQLVLRDKPLL